MSTGDNGFDSKNWVWVPDADNLFTKGYVTDYLKDGTCQVTVVDGGYESQRVVPQDELENCNPAKFNKCDDMAELTHLNEPSVVYNLYLRYNDDLIYTYSGLFLVAINPYKSLSIYDKVTLKKFHSHEFERPPPHIYATAEGTYRNLLSNKKDQSILVTGESGAGKTENTKKIIQYLSSITTTAADASAPPSPNKQRVKPQVSNDIDIKILQANPILESFGNAKTIKNNNSSRFGKFIQIFFSNRGEISGANIDYYLLEKSRVVHQSGAERNYHVFYQFLKGYDQLANFGLNKDLSTYKYLSNSKIDIPHVDDFKEFNILSEAFKIMGFENSEINYIFQLLAIILHLGNLDFTSWKSEQANFVSDAPVELIAELLGVDQSEFVTNVLRPKVKAGREFVQKSKKASEAKFTIDAFAKHLYEKLFQYIIKRINDNLKNDNAYDYDELNFIGVLDIAGFEIFEINSFEQLCINYTNEKLQQFFNHHSFILEQSEYLKEDIQWEFIDFGLDLQPTIDLIETRNPMGLLKLLDEECVIPKSSDKSFMEKLADHWGNGQSKKFQQNKFKSGFIIHHYAGMVEYNVEGWLQKNTDPVSESLLHLLPNSTNSFIQDMFKDDEHLVVDPKRGNKLKTASQKHKDQLNDLMEQLQRTEPHFVRCILPNLDKKSNKFDKNLVLNQLRCNGVLEGIRITRAGYPNRMTFDEFYLRYAIINVKEVYTKDPRTNSELILKFVELDPKSFKIGITKLFFKNGILGKLEEMRDLSLKSIFTDFQSLIRGTSTRSNMSKRIKEVQSSQVLAKTIKQLEESRANSLWMDLFINIKPLLEESGRVLDAKEINENLKNATQKVEQLEMSNKELVESKEALEKSKAELEESKDELIKSREELEKSKEDLEKSKQGLESENAKLKEQISKLEDEIITTTNLVIEKDSKLEKLKSEESRTSFKVKEYEAKVKELKEENEKLSEQKRDLEAHSKQISESHQLSLEELSKLKKEHEDAASEMSTLKATIKEHNTSKADHERSIANLEREHQNLKAKADAEREKLKKLNQKLIDEVEKHKSVLPQHESLVREMQVLRGSISSNETVQAQKSKEISHLKSELNRLQEENVELKKRTSSIESKCNTLESDIQEKAREVKISEAAVAKSQMELTRLQSKLSDLQQLEATTQELTAKVKEQSQEIQSLSASLSESQAEKKSISESLQKLRVDLETAQIAKRDYSERIAVLTKKVEELEYHERERDVNKENSPPDPAFLEDFAHIKLKLNEQSAALRREKFENKKLTEELALMRSRSQAGSPIKFDRSQNRKSVALGDSFDSLSGSSVFTEEINSLKIQLQQEQSNSQRAESYAIDLQKKLNKIQAMRGINSYNDYESKYKESQARVLALERKIEGLLTDDDNLDYTPRPLSRSESLSKVNFLKGSNQEFAQIYQDVTRTLKSTREELTSSKSEILRLKSLLRESEEELYDAKTQNFKTSISDYENQLAKVTVKYDAISLKNSELLKNLELYKKRSEEYFDKLELAESAVVISKRHEEAAIHDMNEIKNSLRLAREEARASQIMIKDLRKKNAELEETIHDNNFNIESLKGKYRETIDKLHYHTSNYDNKEKTDNYREEIRVLNKELDFKLETENALIKDNKKLQLDLEDTAREKDALTEEYEEQVKRIEVLETELAEFTNKTRQLENEKVLNERKITNFTKQVQSLKDVMEDVTKQRDDLLDTKDKLEEEVLKLTHKLEATEVQLEQAKSEGLIMKTHLENQRQESNDIKSELSQSKVASSNEVQDYQKLRKDHLVTKEENITLVKTNKELNAKVHDLEEKLYSNEQLKFWENKVRILTNDLDQSHTKNFEDAKTIKNLQKQIKQLEIRVANESVLTKKYNDENFDFQNKVSHYKSTIDILQNEQSEKDLQIRTSERDIASLKENILILEKEVLELRERLRA
ncbi:P-loop containing nucleoside triphosphate hydrolase protein [Scheffersomyces xylosifermentans]|uniref:P-loop containing nucleoside triphosphate hydrolase protein n=1 Tax=Scheffersomyces xylosifermentans TaxID=1304137 RepID=UPI00315CEF6A